MAKILIVGGTGMLGRPAAVRLHSDGFDIRIFTRNPKRASTFFGDNVEYAQGDVGNKQSLRDAMDSCEHVYINLKGGPSPDDYIRVEAEGSKNVYAAAREAGIQKVVQISGASANEKNINQYFMRGKIEAEKALVASGLIYIILKPSWFCESLPLFVQGSKSIYVGSGKTSFHFLAAADYVRIVSECFQSDKADNKILTILGPEALPIPEAMRRFLVVAYPDVLIKRLPVWLAKWSTMFATNKNLKMMVKFMAFFDKHDDSEAIPGPEEADSIFGRSATTVEEYAKMYRKIVKG